MDFQIVSDYPLTGDNTPAIQKLAQGIMMVILSKAFGVTRCGKTFTVPIIFKNYKDFTLVLKL
jgi:excinuclease UvrABC helicase subunit UvrB